MAEQDLRRRLLAKTDALLGDVERLRLQGILHVPEEYREQIARAAAEMAEGTVDPVPSTPAATHRYLFRLHAFGQQLRLAHRRQATFTTSLSVSRQPRSCPLTRFPADERALTCGVNRPADIE